MQTELRQLLGSEVADGFVYNEREGKGNHSLQENPYKT